MTTDYREQTTVTCLVLVLLADPDFLYTIKSSNMNITLLPGEQKIDTWTILYQPPKGGKFNGKLLVTNQRLLYDAKFDYSAKGILEEFAFIKWGSEGFLEINKADIQAVEVEKSFLAKKCIVILKDGSRHTFNYGAMNIDKCAAAIQSK
ncbi:MAG: hypothetical protein IPG86_11725 [Chitinophagaceae bacterium]|nr:hypothetical protein [Chitinophagaceae bacterium]